MVISTLSAEKCDVPIKQILSIWKKNLANDKHKEPQQELSLENFIKNFLKRNIFIKNNTKLKRHKTDISKIYKIRQIVMHPLMSQGSKLHSNNFTKVIECNPLQDTNSKYVFFEQNGNVHYASNDSVFKTASSQQNNVGNIVIVATEQLGLSNANNSAEPAFNVASQSSKNVKCTEDEDLTSLTWLQDKNLIKGIVAHTKKLTRNGQISKSNIISETFATSTDFIEEKSFDNNQNCLKEQKFNYNSNIGNFIQRNTQQKLNTLITQNKNLTYSTTIRHIGENQINNTTYHQFSDTLCFDNDQVLSSVCAPYSPSNFSINKKHLNNSTFGGGSVPVRPTESISSSYITNISKQLDSEIPSTIIKNQINSLKSNENKSTQNNIQPNILHEFASKSDPKKIQTTFNEELVASSITSHHPHKKYLREQMTEVEKKSSFSRIVSAFKNDVKETVPLLVCSANSKNAEDFDQISTFCLNSKNSPNEKILSSIESNSQMNVHRSNLLPPSTEELNGKPILVDKTASGHNIVNNINHVQITKERNSKIFESNLSSNKDQVLNFSPSATPISKQKHPNNIPYDPKTHANSKPPYSFSSLIFMAIEDSDEKALPVKEIYAWIVQHFPYFKTAPTGWKNSVRHNLSLNKSFLKVEKAPNMGKGSLWRVEQHQRPNLIQALTRSPYYSTSETLSSLNIQGVPKVTICDEKYNLDNAAVIPVKSNLDAKLFPKLSKFMKEMGSVKSDEKQQFFENCVEVDPVELNEYKSDFSSYSNNFSSNNSSIDEFFHGKTNFTVDRNYIVKSVKNCWIDSVEDVNAATAMLALKHGSKIFIDKINNGIPVITNSPSADHTYSAGNGNFIYNFNNSNKLINLDKLNNGCDYASTCASSDAAYESCDESHNLTPDELEHQRRVEGVDALLSLSSVFSQESIFPLNMPILKKPTTQYIEERVSYMENIPHINGKGSLGISGSNFDDGYNTQEYFNQISSLSSFQPPPLSISKNELPSPYPKKVRSSRLRSKIKQIKRKSASLR